MNCTGMEIFKSINYLAVLGSVAWAVVLGNIWYSPKVFFNVWAKEAGLKKGKPGKSDRKKMITAMGTMLATTIIEMLSLAIIIELLGGGIVKAVHAGVIISIGMMAATRLSETFFEQRTIKSWLIQSGFNTLSIIGASVIIGLV